MEQFRQFKPFLFLSAASLIFFSCSKSSSKPRVNSVITVTTLAGSGTQGTNNGNGTSASFNNPSALAYGSNGILYVGDWGNSLIRAITISNAAVTSFAGSGIEGFVDGPAASAAFNGPANITIDKQGDIFVADEENNAIREVTAAGNVVTIAGTGVQGYQDGPAASAMFWHPEGIAVDASGNLYVADGPNNVIRKITVATAIVSTYAGTGVAGFNNGPVASATFNNPFGLTLNASGNIFVADNQNNVIREINLTTGSVSTYAGSGAQGFSNGAAASASFFNPLACAFDSQGNLYVSDFDNNAIRKISTSGVVSTYAGNGTQGSANGVDSLATFNHPIGITVDGSGNVYVADERNSLIRQISATQQ
jgi:sugar lactone lactonase YvrE